MRFGLIVLWLVCMGLPAVAQEQTARAFLEGLAARTPGTTLQDLRGNPEGFLEEAAGVVLGYGGEKGVTEDGLEDAIDAERARVRAREIRRLLGADLNADLNIDAREIDIAIKTASATMRGRLLTWHLAADLSEDGSVSWAELRAFAEQASLKAMSLDRAEAIRKLMAFDLNGNGFVTVKEVREAISLLSDAA